MDKLLFVYNAKSGKAQVNRYLSEIVDIFTKAGYMTVTYPTQCRDDARIIINKIGCSFDRIVCCGGDGTLNEAISGLLGSEWYKDKKVPLGYIPAGSTNDFATSIKLPKKMISAAKVAVRGKLKALDMGSFNEKHFVYVACFGAFSGISYSTSQQLKNILGHQAYIIEGVKQFVPNITTTYNMKIKVNDKVIEGEFIYGMVSNSNSVGGFKGLAGNDVGLDDGLYEVTLVKPPKSVKEFNEIVEALLFDKKSRFVIKFKTRKLKVYSEQKVDWVVDGEFAGSVNKACIKNHHKVINMVTGDNLIYRKND